MWSPADPGAVTQKHPLSLLVPRSESVPLLEWNRVRSSEGGEVGGLSWSLKHSCTEVQITWNTQEIDVKIGRRISAFGGRSGAGVRCLEGNWRREKPPCCGGKGALSVGREKGESEGLREGGVVFAHEGNLLDQGWGNRGTECRRCFAQ